MTYLNRAAMRAAGGLGFGWDHTYRPAPVPRTAHVVNIATGDVLERQHLDCRELIATGEYAWHTPTPEPAEA